MHWISYNNESAYNSYCNNWQQSKVDEFVDMCTICILSQLCKCYASESSDSFIGKVQK